MGLNYICRNDGILVKDIFDLDLAQTLDCGQSFRWTQLADGGFSGIAYKKYVEVYKENNDLFIKYTNENDFKNIWLDYFDLQLDYNTIRGEIARIHPILEQACAYSPGIRVLRQEPFETLCTFIISQNNNIKRIKGIVDRLCTAFGEQIEENKFAFITPEKLASLTVDDLAPIRSGFRARYLIDAAQRTVNGEVDLNACFTLDYEDARKELMKITGVGVKVADCTLLFGMHRIEAFPVDVWMKRALSTLFPGMSAGDFGEYAGIAQQYIFHYSRMHPELFE